MYFLKSYLLKCLHFSEVQDSKNDKEKTSNDPKPNYDSCEAKKDDISQSSDELSQATEQQKLVVLCDQQTSATVESKESENKDSETVSDEQGDQQNV